ncbi:L,D-transpeptidase family protein [Abyssibius alkaniclasticus]|uniref:L,D-transpeptidase family protein n=1 Tax=Abyssibius alkaniclasticus TaxID=2881234 RepID=UPI002364756F|nr:L,D-transpeptidase family protein [Abyssibius alkaniclasticus]UPH72070.1 L,D-transpeptidase family protein [Abyssibius alkaniclasticus]|tara:strand:- start:367 stop:864 length:498 start_codon:yes stop_codon:yes gene_type:complete
MSADLQVSPQGARFGSRHMPCALGRGGIGIKRREGDGITPIGRFELRALWYRADRVAPRCILPQHKIAPHHGWSDDENDPAYNRQITLPHRYHHEKLWRDSPVYDLVGVMDYNLNPVVAGAGSAVFLHVWRGADMPTEGCVALARDDLLHVLAGWTRDSRIAIQP